MKDSDIEYRITKKEFDYLLHFAHYQAGLKNEQAKDTPLYWIKSGRQEAFSQIWFEMKAIKDRHIKQYHKDTPWFNWIIGISSAVILILLIILFIGSK